MADLSDANSSLTIKIVGAGASGTESNFVDATANGIKVDGSSVTQPISGTVAVSNLEAPVYAIRVDDASNTITYIGEAAIGSLASAAVWRIKRTSSTTQLTTIEYADSNSNFDNIWNNRASLTYG